MEDFLEEVISKLRFGLINLECIIMHDRENGIPVGRSKQNDGMRIQRELKNWGVRREPGPGKPDGAW